MGLETLPILSNTVQPQILKRSPLFSCQRFDCSLVPQITGKHPSNNHFLTENIFFILALVLSISLSKTGMWTTPNSQILKSGVRG